MQWNLIAMAAELGGWSSTSGFIRDAAYGQAVAVAAQHVATERLRASVQLLVREADSAALQTFVADLDAALRELEQLHAAPPRS